ncbi:Uncharacterised protein r2_g356 [Pycnogonum litorale]
MTYAEHFQDFNRRQRISSQFNHGRCKPVPEGLCQTGESFVRLSRVTFNTQRSSHTRVSWPDTFGYMGTQSSDFGVSKIQGLTICVPISPIYPLRNAFYEATETIVST